MSIRANATLAEQAALELARKGRGLFGRRERRTEEVIGHFVNAAMTVPPGVLPHEVREELQARIEHTIDALEEHVGRAGAPSPGRAAHDSGVVQQIYALREAEQHLMQTRHLFERIRLAGVSRHGSR